MKTVKLFTLAAVASFCMLFISQTANAQKMRFDSTSKKKIDERTVSYSCVLEEIVSLAQANAIAAKMKTVKGIFTVEASNYASGKANIVVTLAKVDNLSFLQSSLLTAGIKTIYIDTKAVPTEQMVSVIKEMKQAKK